MIAHARPGGSRTRPGRRIVLALAAALAALLALAASDARAAQPGSAAASASAWEHLSPSARRAPTPVRPLVAPRRFAAFALDQAALRDVLADAPRERRRAAAPAAGEGLAVSIPAPDGRLQRFRITNSPVMEPGLAARHPDIQTYTGRGVDDPTAVVRLDLTPIGFHAAVRADDGDWYVDPRYRDRSEYVAYARGALTEDPNTTFVEREDSARGATAAPLTPRAGEANGAPVTLRTYRLALISDNTYATAVGDVTAAKVALVNRVNQLYEQDLAIRMVLVADNDKLNLDTAAKMTGTNGPCGATACYSASQAAQCTSSTLNQNVTVANAIVGSTNYDIGHLVLGTDGGGIAGLGVVGGASKARGCTGLPYPFGDFFAIDYVAHEMGHQFGANHTFNGVNGSCSGGTWAGGATTVEPGSGSSIMSYAGICAGDDLQAHTDPYFSQASIAEISAYVTGYAFAGGATSASGNRAPNVSADLTAVTIPTRTPFVLGATGSDPDGEPLTYLWEQNDRGGVSGTALLANAKSTGPLFRVFGTAARYANPSDTYLSPSPGQNTATGTTSRSFPDLAQVVAGNTNAADGTCPTPSPVTDAIVDCYSEFLPTTDWVGADSSRTMHFRVTARDNHPGAGGIGSADTAVTIDPTAGPFRVTSQATSATVAGTDPLTVTWDVAGTGSGTAVNTADVRITLSLDGGKTFPEVLAAATPNDGSADVTLPRVATTQGRIRVEAVGNVFYDVSRADLTITNADPVIVSGPAGADLGSATVGATGAATDLTFSNDGVSDATLGTVALGGADAAAVQKTADGCSSTTLAAHTSCTVTVRLTPVRTGAHSATLALPSDDPTSPVSVALSGTGVAALTPTDGGGGGTPTTPTTPTTTTTTTTGDTTTTTPTATGPFTPTTPLTPVDPVARPSELQRALTLAADGLGVSRPVLLGSAGRLRLFATSRSRHLGTPKAKRTLALAVCVGGRCSGSATARLTLTARSGKRTHRTIRIGAVRLADGKAAKVTLRLSATVRRAIAGARKATLKLTVTNGRSRVARTYALRT